MPSNSSVETTIADRRIIEIARTFLINFGLGLTRASIRKNININNTIRDSYEKLIQEKISHAKDLLNRGINDEQERETSVELDNKIRLIRQHYNPTRISKPSTRQSRVKIYDPFRNRSLEDLPGYHYQIKCKCSIPPCTFSPRLSDILSPSRRWVHCSIHCHPSIDKVNGCLDAIVGLNKDVILLQQENDLFAPVCSALFIASLFTPLLETAPTFLFGSRSMDRRFSDQFTTSWLAEGAAGRVSEVSRVNQKIYSLVRPLGPKSLFSVMGILAATLWVLRTEISEPECEVPS